MVCRVYGGLSRPCVAATLLCASFSFPLRITWPPIATLLTLHCPAAVGHVGGALPDNKLGPAEAQALAPSLAKLTQLQKLDLHGKWVCVWVLPCLLCPSACTFVCGVGVVTPLSWVVSSHVSLCSHVWLCLHPASFLVLQCRYLAASCSLCCAFLVLAA